MYRTLLITVIVAPLAWTEPAAARQESTTVAVTDTVMENGLEVIVVENHDVPLATVLVAVRNGAISQQREERGMAHLMEHMLFRAFGDGLADFHGRVAGLQAYSDAMTGEEVVAYYLVLPSENMEKGVRLLSRLIQEARFREDDLTEELPVVLDEMARGVASPEDEMRRAVQARLWGDDWYRRDVIGDSASLGSISVEEMRENHDQYYLPKNSALIVTGDATGLEVVRAASKHFGEWGDEGDTVALPEEVPSFAPFSSIATQLTAGPVFEATIVVQLRGPGMASGVPSVVGTRALVEVLNDPGSRFQERLVSEGPFQSLRVRFTEHRSEGVIEFDGTSRLDVAAQAAAALLTELDTLDSHFEDVGGAAQAASKREELSRALTLERTAILAPAVALAWGRRAHRELWTSGRGDPGQDELLRVVRRYVQGKGRVIGILVSEPWVETVRSRIEQWGRER